MKRIIILLCSLLMVACSNQHTFDLPLNEYPQTFHQEVSKLPKDIQEKMKVPTKFPFEVKFFRFSVSPEVKNGSVLFTSVEYEPVDAELSDKINMTITTYYDDELSTGETIELSDGTEVVIKNNREELKEIEWSDQKNVRHTLAVMHKDIDISIEQLKNMANSIKEVK
ncbi:hypothetical protein [Bacillus seohaeanensis]|jgi:hypothetical protein|uniref:DUF4367 domain-containing protein n=1 Tax=Bacillus seohaeanensis TaxID=284580 RepID=A0ABW5RSX6_9BACI